MAKRIIRSIETPPTDADRASAFVALTVLGRWSDCDKLMFEFERKDGEVEKFTSADMRAARWWHSLPQQVMESVKANLRAESNASGVAA